MASYEMVDKNGDLEAGVRVNVNGGENSANFITANFHEECSDPVSTDTMPIAEQLTRSPDQSMRPALTYGCLKSTWVDETCYIRPKYLKFALHKGALQSLRELLCDKWRMDDPKFLINVFQSSSQSSQSSETREKLKEIVKLGRRTDSWFIAHSQTDPMVGYYNREESQKSATSHRNIVYWKTWSEISEEDQTTLTPQSGSGKRIHIPEVEITGDDSIDQKMTSQLSSCFLFPEYSSSSKVTALRDHLVLVKELSKAFDEDGHKDICKNVALHVCSPLNIFVPASDSPSDELSDEDRDLLAELLKSGIPTILLYSQTFLLPDFLSQLGDRLNGYSEGDLWVRAWVKEDANPGNPDPSSSHSFSDLAMGLKDVLVESRKHGVDKGEQKMFRNKNYTDLYLSIVLGLDEECRRIITDDNIRKKEGIKESLVSMIYFYKRFDLLDVCIKNNYGIRMCVYNGSSDDKVEMMMKRASNSITNDMRDQLSAEEYKNDRPKLQADFYKLINRLIGKDSWCSFSLNPLDDPNKLPIEEVMFIFYCFNEEWEMAEIMRKYSDFSIFKCFVAIKAMQKIKRIRSNTASSDYFDVQSLDDMILKMDRQAGSMVEGSYKRGLDVGPVVFWEHPQYNDKTILDLAEETQCYSILENKTHIHSYITSRWNRALDPTTCWLKIVLSWLTFGLLAPCLIKYVPKQSKRDEKTLFLNEKGTKRNFLEKIIALWTSPRSKCYLLMLTYLVFLFFQTLVILDTTRIKPVPLNIPGALVEAEAEDRLQCNILVCLVFVLCFLSVEVDFSKVTRYNIIPKLGHYFNGGYNKVDLFSAFTFLLYVILTFALQGDEDAFLAAKVILSLSYIGYIVRFTQFLQLFEDIGPKLISIKNMLADLVFFASFLLLTIFAYGIVSEFLLHPYPRTVPAAQIVDILKRPYVNMFGELDLDTLEQGIETGVCKYENYLNGTAVENASCDEYTCKETCERFKLIARIMLGVYTMVTVILLTNLLVSIFGKTYESDFDKTKQLWQLQRYKLVKEAESQFFLPFPPFNLLHSVYKGVFSSCPCCPTGKDTDFYEQYVKEVEYRCSRQLQEDEQGD